MYDRLVRAGLRECSNNQAINPENFYHLFNEFYNNSLANIENAERFITLTYPYRPRIAEKYLWLIGNPNQEIILDRFIAGIRMAGMADNA
jgi:hypothetical protein